MEKFEFDFEIPNIKLEDNTRRIKPKQTVGRQLMLMTDIVRQRVPLHSKIPYLISSTIYRML